MQCPPAGSFSQSLGSGFVRLLTNKVGAGPGWLFLFDRFISAAKDRQRYAQAERLGCLEIDDEFDFRRLLNRQIGRFFAIEDAADIVTDDAMLLGGARAVADQAASHGEFAKAEERGQPVAKSLRRKSFRSEKKKESARRSEGLRRSRSPPPQARHQLRNHCSRATTRFRRRATGPRLVDLALAH